LWPRPLGEARANSLTVQPEGLLTADGQLLRALSCQSVDVRSLDPTRRDAITVAFERLLRSLEVELHISVRVRRLTPEQMEPDGAGDLDRAQVDHWRAHLRAAPVHRRTIFIGARGDAIAVDREVGRITDALLAAGMSCAPVDGATLAAVVGGSLASGASSWREGVTGLRLGGELVNALTLQRLPGIAVSAGWLAPLLLVRTPCDIAISFTREDEATAMRLLGRRLRDLGAHRLHELDRGFVPDAGVAAGYEAAAALRARLAQNAGRPLRLTVGVVTRETAGDAGALQRVRAAVGAMLATARVEHFRHAATAAATWGLAPWPDPGKLIDSRAGAMCLPFVSASADDGAGYRLGHLREDGLPVRLDIFDSARYANANIGIFAASGQGKSFLIGGILMEARRTGTEAIVVDPEGEYRSLVEATGGRWLDLVTEAPINPFDAADGEDPTAAVVDTVSLLCAGLGDVDRAHVDAAARRAIARRHGKGAPLLRECLADLAESAPRIALVVGRHVDGPLRGFLDAPTSPHWSDGFIAVGHRDIRDELVPVTTMLLARFLWHRVRHDRRRRHIVLDEAGMLAAHPALRGLLGQLARRCRKYGSSLVVATQNVNDLLKSDDGQVVAGNCAVVFCGGHRAHEAQLMQRTFGLTDDQGRAIETAGRGDFLLLAGHRRAAITVNLPPLYAERIRGAVRPPA
jgi:hypothetical protein